MRDYLFYRRWYPRENVGKVPLPDTEIPFVNDVQMAGRRRFNPPPSILNRTILMEDSVRPVSVPPNNFRKKHSLRPEFSIQSIATLSEADNLEIIRSTLFFPWRKRHNVPPIPNFSLVELDEPPSGNRIPYLSFPIRRFKQPVDVFSKIPEEGDNFEMKRFVVYPPSKKVTKPISSVSQIPFEEEEISKVYVSVPPKKFSTVKDILSNDPILHEIFDNVPLPELALPYALPRPKPKPFIYPPSLIEMQPIAGGVGFITGPIIWEDPGVKHTKSKIFLKSASSDYPFKAKIRIS